MKRSDITGEAEAILPARNNAGKPITVIGTEAIRASFDPSCIEQALNSPRPVCGRFGSLVWFEGSSDDSVP
mgnify:CR=1 FL=1